jgi:hypothetical protein
MPYTLDTNDYEFSTIRGGQPFDQEDDEEITDEATSEDVEYFYNRQNSTEYRYEF